MNSSQEIHLKLEDFRFKKVIKQKVNPVKIEYEPELIDKVQKIILKPHSQDSIQIKKEEPILVEPCSNRKNFLLIFEKMKEMRKELSAPVDTLVAELQPEADVDDETWKFQLLVSLVLSPQTKDGKTASAMTKLKKHGFTLANLSQTPEEKIFELVREVNYNKTKAKHLKKLCTLLNEEYCGRIPAELNEVMKLPGVGKKVGLLYIFYAHNKDDGIAVDTHVHRISNWLDLVQTKAPEDTRLELQSFIDRELWREVNELFVGFGQIHCTPVRPKCGSCKLNDICGVGIRNMKALSQGSPFKKIEADALERFRKASAKDGYYVLDLSV